MFIAKNNFGDKICARCGRIIKLTKDHFIPKSCRMTVNENGNYVGLCEECNREKADKFVIPSWYTYLTEDQKESLNRYMRYSRSWIRSNCNDHDILSYMEKL